MAKLFGFDITRKKKDLKSFAAPENTDGAVDVSVGGALGHYIDMEGKIKNEIELINKYRSLATESEVDAAIVDVVNESVVISSEREDAIFLDLNDLGASAAIKDKIHDEFTYLLRLLNFNKQGYEIFRNWYIDGRLYFHMVIDDKKPKQGIQELRYIDPRKIRKVRESVKERAENGVDVVSSVKEFYVYNEKLDNKQSEVTKGIRISPDSVSYIHSGMYENTKGLVLSYLHKAIKPMNQLRMMEDSVVIYRISRAPERRLFYIDVGNLPKAKAEQYLRDQMNRFQNKLVYDVDTGEIKDERKHMSMLEDFWLPRREGGRGTEISTLPGGQNLGEMEDVTFFQTKLYRALNVPPSRLEQASGFSLGRESEITRDELKFSKFIGRLRNQFTSFFDNILRSQLILKGIIREEQWDAIKSEIQYKWAEDSYYRETKNSEMLMARLSLLREVADYAGRYFSMDYIKQKVLMMTDEEIREMQKEIDAEVKGEKIHKDATIEWGSIGPQPDEPEAPPAVEAEVTDEEFISGIEHDKKLNKIFEMMGEGSNGKRKESIG